MSTKKYNWDEIISNFQQSKLSQAEFCRQNQLNAKYLNLQLSKRNFTKSKNTQSDATHKKSVFVKAIQSNPQAASSSLIIIELNHIKIKIQQNDPIWLADFCKALSL
ncbi:IS66 family insertion sequence element accessory protein TnpA [Marinicellulosiphila megalodicopiae]|uniref:IS66 family insertion sequence element accessory protein TnpA n=1 Tax=Marinicellulosiphila megalodicopiae TaxID=2724896 RepID=UPI003BAE71B7